MKTNKKLRFVITTFSMDGTYTRHYKGITRTAVKRLNEAIGAGEKTKKDVEMILGQAPILGMNRLTTTYSVFGETIEYGFAYVGDCQICKSKSERLYELSVQLDNLDTNKLQMLNVNVCGKCLNDYETRKWYLRKRKGKIKVVKS